MMKQICMTAVLLVLSIISIGQDSYNKSIIFDRVIYDFGVIEKGSKAECIFTFINKSPKPVAVTGVKVACGCTVPSWSKEPVAPGSSGKIEVKYNSNITGSFHKTITILTTADTEPDQLTMKGEVNKKGKKE